MSAPTSARDVELWWSEAGQGDPVVLVHGSASDARTWDAQYETLAARWRVIRYSRRYHWPNPAAGPDVVYAMVNQVDDLLEVLDALALSAVHLVGHSYGAYVGLMAALRERARFASLVLAEPPVIPLVAGYPPGPAGLARLLVRRPVLGLTLLRFLATGLGPARAAARRGDMDEALRRFGRGVLGRESFAAMTPERLEQARVNFSAAEVLSEEALAPLRAVDLSALHMPVLLIGGDRSPAMFRLLLSELESALPRVSRATIAGASHNMHESHGAAFNAAVADFLTTQPRGVTPG